MASENSPNLKNCAFGVYCTDGTVEVDGDVTVIYSNTQNELPYDDFPLPKQITTFHGRDQEFNELDSLFFEKNNKKIVLCGLSGYGKTELSKQFAQRCLDNNRVTKLIWIKAEVKEELAKLHPKLNKIYGGCDENCLLVFDNGICRNDIFDYEPPEKDNFFMLITSQENDWGDDVTPLQLDTLSDESALEVLKLILGNNYKQEDHNLYIQLINCTDKIPKNLQILGGDMRQHINILRFRFYLKDYVEKIEQSQKEIFNKTVPRSNPNGYEKSNFRTEVSSNKGVENGRIVSLDE